MIRKLGDGDNAYYFACVNDSHFSDGSHIHYMRRLPDVYDPKEPVHQDALRMHPRHHLPTPVLPTPTLPST
jgi:hypothetical protein